MNNTNTSGLAKGDIVRSIKNHCMTYRVMFAGMKRAKLVAKGVGYFSCYCPVELLRKVAK